MSFQNGFIPLHNVQSSSLDFILRQVTRLGCRDHERQIPRCSCEKTILKPDQCNFFCLWKLLPGLLEGCSEFHSVNNFSHGDPWSILQKSLHLILSDPHGQGSREPHHGRALHIFRLITFFKKCFLQQILNKTILNQIVAKDLLDAMRFNSLCQTFFHPID